MESIVEKFIRDELKKGLEECTDKQRIIFKRMYSHDNIDKDVNKIIDDMDEKVINGALSQVLRTVNKNNEMEAMAVKISDKKKTELYGAIADTIMDERVKIKTDGCEDVDEMMFKLNLSVWSAVEKALGIDDE